MAVTLPSLHDLEEELLTLVKSTGAFKNEGFSIYNLADLTEKTGSGIELPLVAVGYDGMELASGNQAISTRPNVGAGSAVQVNVQFVVVLAIAYQYTGQSADKQAAFDLLDQVRQAVLGYQGVNLRAWRFMGERPEPEASGDGIVFYSQVWQTSVTLSSK